MKKLSKLSFLCVAIVMIAQVFIPTISIAFLIPSNYTDTSSVTLGIQSNRTYDGEDAEYSFDYDLAEQNIFKIGESNGGSSLDLSNLYYCLEYGIGFGADAPENETLEYNYWCDLNDEDANATKIYNVNAVRWLADKMYVPNSPTTAESAKIRARLLSNAGISNSVLTDNDIDVVQQFVLWSFVRDDSQLFEVLRESSFSLGKAFLKIDGNQYSDDANDDFDLTRAEQIDELYDYLSYTARNIKYFDNYTSGVKINSYDAEITEVQINGEEVFKVGPFTLSGNRDDLIYDFNYQVSYGETKDAVENSLPSSVYKIYDESNHEINLENAINDGNFYIAISKNTVPQVGAVSLNINYTEFNTKASIWVSDGDTISNMANQPVLKVEKETRNLNVSARVLSNGISDLVLRKYIQEIIRTEGRSEIIVFPEVGRTPTVDGLQGFLTGESTTAVYTHPKTPVPVKKGDLVKYVIRIYNEGEVIDRPAKITDFLPEGLEFVPENETNIEYGWEADGQNISTTYLSDNNIVLPVYNYYGGRLPVDPPVEFYDGFYYVDIPIICRVASTVEPDELIRNIAAITAYDKEDIDSSEEIHPDYYYPPVDNSSYQEDDDDYEIVYVEREFDLSLRKYISSVTTEGVTTTYEDAGARTPNINNTILNSNGVTTAEYKHKKEPIVVDEDSLVNYKIVIYNEGDIAGRATRIADVLPEGLEFVQVISGNFVKQGTNTTGKIILERQEGNEDNLDPYVQGEDLDSEVIEIQCRVTTIPDENDDKVLTNLAWIDNAYNSEGKPDRDSTPANTTEPASYVTTDIGYINETYNSDLELDNPNSYFEGQEDDDDFEKVVLKHINGNYSIVLVKEDAEGEQLNETATFEVNGVEKTVTGRLVIAEDVRVTPSNFRTADIYEIVETVPPDKYSTFPGTIKIEVPKKKEGTSYVVDEDNMKYYVDDVEVRGNSRDDLDVYFDADSGNIFVKVKDYQFDLALRKYISSVTTEGTTTVYEEVGSRKPNVNEDVLDNNDEYTAKTTADYKHKKDPVVVEEDSLVNYKITIYNEGEIEGRATRIVDQLPAGLEFVRVVSGNFVQDGTNTTGRIVLVRQEGNEDNLNPHETGEELDSEVIEIQCRVTTTPDESNNKVLTNIAWIDAVYNSRNAVDRDSNPANTTLPTDLVTSDVGYINEDKNGELELDNRNSYFEGQEDDDDFEKVIIKPVNGLYNLVIVKQDSKGEQINKVSKFEVNGVEKTVTGRATVIENVNVTPESLDTPDVYLIKEVEAPDQYGAFPGTIKIMAYKTRSGERYILDHVEYVVDSKDNGTFEEYDLPDLNVNFDNNTGIISVSVTDYQFDLALRKYITNIQRKDADVEFTDRTPEINTADLKNGTATTAKYVHSKDPVTLKQGDIITFTIRVYNEGEIDGYVNEITDYLPAELGFLNGDEVNADWQITSPNTDIEPALTIDGLDGIDIVYAKEGKNLEITNRSLQNNLLQNNLLKKYGAEKEATDMNWQESTNDPNDGLFYQDVMIKCIVLAKNNYEGIIKNVAEITDARAFNVIETTVEDRDSQVNNVWDDNAHIPGDKENGYTPGEQDDDDFEPIQLKFFDLALRKFITEVNEKAIPTSRVPKFTEKDGKYVYEHSKDPVYVTDKDVITYTIRIFNEGTMSGYAEEIEDDIPEGLVFLPENNVNTTYRWKMYYYDEDGNLTETDDVAKAEVIRTDYLSQANGADANLLNGFDKATMTLPDFKDVKVAFKVSQVSIPEENTERIIVNKAQITEDSDDDEDSTPNKWLDEDDDQDIEKIYVQEFDLALYKWVTETIVTVDGQTTSTETGFKPNIGLTESSGDSYRKNSEAEPIAKVEVDKKKLNKTGVKFVYNIKVVNEGEIAGYATEITDYIPYGLEFNADDNPLWTIGEKDGTITTRALEKKLLEPGKDAIIPVVLTWVNDADNLGIKKNIAAITEDYNEKNIQDIDSIVGNEDIDDYEKEQEDDDDFALVILALKTGNGMSIQYISLALGVLAIIGTGVVLIKKYVI